MRATGGSWYCGTDRTFDDETILIQHQRTKHVALKYFFVRDIVRDKIVKVRYISTRENVSDILTKSTSKQIFAYLQPRLMNIKQLSTAAFGALSRIVG